MSKASLELGGGNWAAKDGKLLGYAVGDTSGKYIPREFTFSRGADIAATRVNKDGLIEKYRENLLTYSNQFDTTWTTTNISLTSGQSGHDGSNDAWLAQGNGLGTSRLQHGGLDWSNSVYTLSFYAKAGTESVVNVFDGTWSGVIGATYDLSTGTATQYPISIPVVEVTMVSVGNGWWRCSFTAIPNERTNTSGFVRIGIGSTTAANSGNIYIQDAQLEYGLVATDYLESGSTTGKAGVLDNLPRIDYTSGSAQLLMEPQRKNELAHSEYFGGWSIKSGATETSNSIISPDGLQNASTISETTALTNYIGQNYTFTASTEYSYSVFVKNGTSSKMRLQVYDSSQYSTIDFDQSDSVTYSANLDSYDFVDYGNGWRRVIITFTTSAGAGSGYVQIYPDRNGNNEYLYAYGAMLELGSYPTSYIPTYGSSVTRAKDSFQMNLQSQGIFDGSDTEGVLMVEYEKPNTLENVDLMRFMGASAVGRAFIYNSGVNFAVDWSGISSGVIDHDSNNKTLWRLNSLSTGNVFHNGTKLTGNSTGTAWSDIRLLRFNMEGAGGVLRIKQILLFPTALTDAECIELTTI